MKQGKILEKHLIGGKTTVFRYPKPSDARGAMETINSQVEEKVDIARMSKVTLKEEKRWLASVLKAVKKKGEVLVAIEVNGEYAGSCEITRDEMNTRKHIGTLGIGLRKEIRGLGIGKRAMQICIEEAKKSLGISIVKLEVYNTNKPGIGLYKKLGFRITGRIKKGALHWGKYKDDITMVKYL